MLDATRYYILIMHCYVCDPVIYGVCVTVYMSRTSHSNGPWVMSMLQNPNRERIIHHQCVNTRSVVDTFVFSPHFLYDLKIQRSGYKINESHQWAIHAHNESIFRFENNYCTAWNYSLHPIFAVFTVRSNQWKFRIMWWKWIL